jgi:hypothetical protein
MAKEKDLYKNLKDFQNYERAMPLWACGSQSVVLFLCSVLLNTVCNTSLL